MRFGDVRLEDALGVILAHAVHRGGLVLKKGRRLTADDLMALRAQGIASVTAAALGPDDIHEDEAAQRLAAAVAGDGTTIEAPFTGRVNLFASARGVVRLDRARLHRLNAVDEALTLATLPDLAPVRAGQMVATIKIIPFAVPERLLETCLGIAREGAPPVALAAYRALDVALIQTRLPGTKETVLDKTVGVTAARVAATGGHLVSEARCPHAVGPLAERIRASSGDLLLIAGASAITDRRDVLPAAIEAAGGVVEHLGMPVDPGNLLLLGRLGTRAVLGLPGCARSPKLNGFDWVLERLAAGIAVRPADLMAMGVGGLLMEIPSRPQPRAGGRIDRGPVVALILAAGQSRRMGTTNKLLAPLDGHPLVTYAVDAALTSRVDEVIVVTGHEAERVQAALGGRSLRLVHNPDYADGLSTSLQAGLRALPEDTAGIVVVLGDMPRIDAATIDRLIAAFDPSEGRSIVIPTVRGKRGNPVLLSTRYLPELEAIAGDVGARHLLGAHAEEVTEIEMDDDVALLDVDTPEALEALIRLGKAPSISPHE